MGWRLLKANVHKRECASESPGGLVKTQMLSPPPGFLIEWFGVALYSNTSPSDAADAAQGSHFEDLCLRVWSQACSLGRYHLN